jgi:hypothetical protein
MLAQQPPFHGPVSTVLHGHAYRQPRPLHRLDPGIPLAMSEAVGRMLAKSVEVRYHTGAEFVRAMAVAERRRSGSAPFDHLLPLADRERRRGPSAKVLLYFPVALVLTVLVTGLAVWAGYELAQQQFSRAIPTPRIIVVTRPAPVETPLIGHSEAATAPTIAVSKSATPEPLVVLSDRLQPTVPRPTPSPSPTPANPVVEVAFNPSPELPSQQGQFVFYNPTGYDLIVDLTGPTPASLLVPPGGQEEILLQPGRYQVILHTPTGTGLSSKVGTFTVNGGQVMTQDYYSESYETVQ